MIIIKNYNVEADSFNIIVNSLINNRYFFKKKNFLQIVLSKKFDFSQIIFFFNNKDIPFIIRGIIAHNIIYKTRWH